MTSHPIVFSIPVQRAFADGLVAGLIDRFADGALGLAEGLILLPSNRARSAVQAALVRASGAGLLMPRLAVIGDADLDESVALALDAIDAADPIPPAIDSLKRRLMLAGLIERHHPAGEEPITGAAAFQLAEGLGRVIDQLHYEEVAPARLSDLESALGDLAGHWQASWQRLRLLVDHWPGLLAATGHIDRADRRNRLLARVSAGWRTAPPARFVVAAGVTTAAPAIARLLRTVADLPQGMVVLPGLDLAMAAEEWDALGPVKADPENPGERALETHPQYHLKLLLGRMGIAREEVGEWAAASPFDGPAARAPFLSLLFAPAAHTARWQAADNVAPSLSGVSAAVFADDGQEAQGIALMMRAAIEVPGRTAALVTPDRLLAERVAAALERWGLKSENRVDDSAGQSLGRTPPGALLLMLAEFAAGFDPVRLVALLGHPLVRAGEGRLDWLDQVRRLDLVLRGPGLVPGWAGVTARIAECADDSQRRGHDAAEAIADWWGNVAAGLGAALTPFAAGVTAPPPVLLGALQDALGWLTGEGAWTGHAGRALSEVFDRWALAKGDGPALVAPADFPKLLADLLTGETVRPPYGGHPRLFIWGLLEARLQRADLMILGGLDEGRWPPQQSPDPWLAPGIRRLLGLAAPERQQGMAAHDFAGAFAAREVVVTRAQRSSGDPAVASRFWLRLTALAGELPVATTGDQPVTTLAAMLDVPPGDAIPAAKPRPAPPLAARPDRISVTGVDQLARDPYAFYAAKILRLSELDPLSSGPDAKWFGTRVHKFLQDWQAAGLTEAAFDAERAALRADPALDSLARAFWLPRIEPSLRWAAERVWAARDERWPVANEVSGKLLVDGITLHGTADRVDQAADGTLAIVDYKTGAAPSGKSAGDGLNSQLGLLGLLAEEAGLGDLAPEPAGAFEYWELKRDRKKGVDGAVKAIKGQKPRPATAAAVVERAREALAELTTRFLLGQEPFVPGDSAKRYADFDQLMRRDEWFGRGTDGEGGGVIDPAKLLKNLDPGQQAAAQPDDHVWLGASAGTGKTQVLSARVLRLMLEGVSPEAVLCITFTKAGAAEMAHRIHERLAMWVRMEDGDLRLDLAALGADWRAPGILDRARSLFATVIDSPGGAVRVQTIHSFCQTLLASFPLEAKILPGFRALEDGEASALQREVLGQLLARADADGDAMRTIAAMLSQRLGQDAAIAFLARCASSFTAADAPRLAPKAHDLRTELGLPQGDPLTWQAAALAGGAIADADIAAVAASGRGWGTKTGDGRADIMDDWARADPHGRAAMLAAVRGCFVTATGDMRADYTKDKGGMRSCLAAAERIVAAADDLLATATAMAVADDLATAWDLGSRFAEAYAMAKRERGFADFDDLISIAGHLLAQGDFGDWVRFKLDQRTDHILVDEAQDTNARQWAIIASLAGEFFAGVGAKDDRIRTMFTVGDRKQAIFGFQGTEPAAFEAARLSFAKRAAEGGRPFEDVDLDTNYRSSPAVLDVVDAWIGAGATELMGLDSDEPPHIPAEFNRDRAGRVELWAPLPVGKALDVDAADEVESDDGDEGAAAGIGEAAASDPASLRLSRAIADEVQDWIANGKDGRSVAPGDILILVRRRRDLAARIVARLQSLHVPVAGVDRFSLTQSLAVQDLLAAMRFAVQPLDDLNLAGLLVSPLLGWTQDDLFGFAHGRKGSALWEQLRARESETPPETMAALRALLGMADFTTPFRFLDAILSGPIDGRRKLYHRLGREARDPIDELLGQALAFERQEAPSLLGFLSHIAASTAEIKRQTEARSDVVRVMTVHGSKGLQAPIVILADATDDPKPRRLSFGLSMGGWTKLPVFALGKDERHGAIAAAHDAKERAEREEHWRLLYVAMTRAEELLVVTGTRKSDELPEGNWYSAVDAVMGDMGAEWQDAGPRWGQKRVHAVHPKKWARPVKDKARSVPPPVAVPPWARQAAPEEARPPRPLAPSALGEDDVAAPPQGSDRAAAVSRGLLLHALFERLPPVAPDQRQSAAMRWLAVQAAALDDAARAAMVAEVLAVLDDPEHAALFGPGSLAEVPLSAVVDGTVVAGIVDRLLVTADAVTVIDFKTGRHVPRSAAEVAPAYLRQMAAYRGALAAIFPGRRIEAALLYTAAPRLIGLDDALLDAYKPGLAATKANLGG